MPVLENCKFKDVAIKTEGTMPRTRSNMGFYSIQGQVTPRQLYNMAEIQTHSRFMSVLDTCKVKEVAMKTEDAMPKTRSNMGFLALKGK